MFMSVVPTYIVEYSDIQGQASWRVSGLDNLKVFIDILMLNEIDDFKVTKEKI